MEVSRKNKSTEAVKGEMLLVMNKICNRETFSSFDNYIKLLKHAISDSEMLSKMTVARTKATYLTTEAIGPYFHGKMIASYDNVNFYCLLFDEATNEIKKKQLQISIRFFSQISKQVRLPGYFIYFSLFSGFFAPKDFFILCRLNLDTCKHFSSGVLQERL